MQQSPNLDACHLLGDVLPSTPEPSWWPLANQPRVMVMLFEICLLRVGPDAQEGWGPAAESSDAPQTSMATSQGEGLGSVTSSCTAANSQQQG